MEVNSRWQFGIDSRLFFCPVMDRKFGENVDILKGVLHLNYIRDGGGSWLAAITLNSTRT